MAIFQPTNIIPSSFTQGTVDVNDTMEISWQVNGNSAMTAFQIDFYLNDANSTYVTSTGKLTDNCPFYGTDRFGNPQFFTYNARAAWKEKGLANGNNYKYKITQFYNGKNDEVVLGKSADGGTRGLNTIILPDNCPYKGYIQFYLTEYTPDAALFYYSFTQHMGWYINPDSTILNFVHMEYKENIEQGEPMGNVLRGEYPAPNVDFLILQQNVSNIFITRDKPTLTIQSTDKNFDNAKTFPDAQGNFSSSIGFFKAVYQQEQDDSIRWVRWQVATANNGVIGDILADTGDIYTPTLNYEFNGFFNGQQYAIRAIGESESGQATELQGAGERGWIFFKINIENQGQYTGNFTTQCLHKENATLLEWEGVEVVLPAASGKYTLNDGLITLAPAASILWKKEKNNEILPFNKPWTAVWKGILQKGCNPLSEEVNFSGETVSYTEFESPIVNITVGDESEDPALKVYKGTRTYQYPTYIGKISNISVSLIQGGFRGEATFDNERRVYTVTLYSRTPSELVEAFVNISYFYYVASIEHICDGTITSYNVKLQSSNVVDKKISFKDNKISVELYAYSVAPVNLIADVNYYQESPLPQGGLLEIDTIGGTISLSREENPFIVKIGENIVATIQTPTNATRCALLISPNLIISYFYEENKLLGSNQTAISYTQSDINTISISGANSGATVDSVSVYKGDGLNILPLYQDSNFEPAWNNPNYSLYMTANFNGNLEGGTSTVSGDGFRVYRQEVGKNYLTPIATVPSTITSVKDYGISSRKAYKYSLHAYDINGAFMGGVEAQNTVATCFGNYSLLVCDYDETNDEYHVRKQYLFALNLSTGSVGNNNKPTLNANFTPYPTRMGDTANYASGTLQGLIGAIYTVPALIEQIGNYKHTAKPSTMDYFDSVDLEKELYDLSVAPYTLFLRDMKGHLRMIATSGAISMTLNIKQKQQSISISFPWVEIGDASDVTIIQTPDDFGWNNDNQVLDVRLDVDVETGELSATYPFPYNGTKFYLTGANKENLTAKTPIEVTPAQFNLSEVAKEPDDGEVTATVTVNSENN